MREPRLTLRGEPINLPETGEHFEMLILAPDGSCRLLAPGGVTVARSSPPDSPPQLLPGENAVEFGYDADAGACEFEARVMRLLP